MRTELLDPVSPPEGRCVELLAEAVCEVYGLSSDQLCGPRRDARTAEARQLCMYLARRAVGLSLQCVGRVFGGRHHGTVLHAERTICALLETDRRFRLRAMRVAEVVLGRVRCADTQSLAGFVVDALSVGQLQPTGLKSNNEQMEFCVA